ncbi:hypothetical protein EZV62_024438 [Acer yangbiense]|uniref:FAD-binding domain-containing protein n=1 Tax=Acer yangbiense TaxID=1000413 RepID=A0A5C7GV49_9ROSI|nr:hypothetical protein EZV62_024438 [Acer yangbiense]
MNEYGPRTSVHRKALLEALADELPKYTIRFSSKIVSIEAQTQQGSSVAVICLSDGTVIKAKDVMGRGALTLARTCSTGEFRTTGRVQHGRVSSTSWPHGLNQEFGFSRKMAGNPQMMQKQVIENYVKDFPPLLADIVQHTDLSTLTWAPLMFRLPWDIVLGNLTKGNITLAGDAMHPMTPDIAQGGCAALEDAVVLRRHIGKMLARDGGRLVPSNIPRALDGYVKERRWHVA